MPAFIQYQAKNGRKYALHPEQIRGFDGDDRETRVLATIGGQPLTFRVAKPYEDVLSEWRKAIEQAEETA